MTGYWVTLRGIAEQQVHVEADSKREARQKAAGGDFDDAVGYPDWMRDEHGNWRHWPAAVPVEEDP